MYKKKKTQKKKFDLCTGGPLIVLKNGSIFLAKPYYENTNEMAVLWEELQNLLNKKKPYYREIRTMRGRTMRGLPVIWKNKKPVWDLIL